VKANGPSLQARILELVFRLGRARKGFETPEGLRAAVAAARPAGSVPTRELRRHFCITESSCAGRPLFTLSPRDRVADLLVLYLHGGAYVYEISKAQWAMLGKILRRANAECAVPLYPLAPEHSCPETLAYALEAYRAVRAAAGGKKVVVLGDSAGGGLALALDRAVRTSGEPQPDGLVLISPWLDVTCADPRQDGAAHVDPLLAIPGLREAGRMYAGDLSPADPRVSPLFGDLGALPPTLVLTGTHDLLNADARRLHALANSTLLTTSEYVGALHVFPKTLIPEAKRAVEEIASFFRRVAQGV
jgi:monoterpene epsilon-lactone hydrolase